jgi:transcriptional regulator with XRE-family HTH domain
MGNRKRRAIDFEARRRLAEQMAREGGKIRAARKRRRLRQADLGARAGLSQTMISKIELGKGGALSLVAWQRLAIVLDLPLRFELGRDRLEEPRDAGHLAIQELVLRLGRATGRRRTFELATKPSDPSRSVDVGLIDDAQRVLIRVECVNSWGDIGASIRSSDRKRAEAEALAIAIGAGTPFAVRECWVVRATRRNRELVARYPELFATRFPGSSRAWTAALVAGAQPPYDRGLVWCDIGASRIFEWRTR